MSSTTFQDLVTNPYCITFIHRLLLPKEREELLLLLSRIGVMKHIGLERRFSTTTSLSKKGLSTLNSARYCRSDTQVMHLSRTAGGRFIDYYLYLYLADRRVDYRGLWHIRPCPHQVLDQCGVDATAHFIPLSQLYSKYYTGIATMMKRPISHPNFN